MAVSDCAQGRGVSARLGAEGAGAQAGAAYELDRGLARLQRCPRPGGRLALDGSTQSRRAAAQNGVALLWK